MNHRFYIFLECEYNKVYSRFTYRYYPQIYARHVASFLNVCWGGWGWGGQTNLNKQQTKKKERQIPKVMKILIRWGRRSGEGRGVSSILTTSTISRSLSYFYFNFLPGPQNVCLCVRVCVCGWGGVVYFDISLFICEFKKNFCCLEKKNVGGCNHPPPRYYVSARN